MVEIKQLKLNVHAWQVLKRYWFSRQQYLTGLLFLSNIVLSLISIKAIVALNNFNKNFYDALQKFDLLGLQHAIWQFLLILLVLFFTDAYRPYLSGLIALRWRRGLTTYFLNLWTRAPQAALQGIENLDQRLSDDVEQLTTMTVSLFFQLFEAAVTLLTFSILLWQLSQQLLFHFADTTFTIPGYLFWGALLYASLGTIAIFYLGRNLRLLDYYQQQKTADFRFALMEARIAQNRSSSTQQELLTNFYPVFHNSWAILRLKKRLACFTSGYNNIAFMFGLALAIPLFWHKKLLFGGLMQISHAFEYAMSAFSVLINVFPQIAAWQAVVFRLAEVEQRFSHKVLAKVGPVSARISPIPHP